MNAEKICCRIYFFEKNIGFWFPKLVGFHLKFQREKTKSERFFNG